MPTFNISDITPAGAFANAVTAAQDSDHRNADRRFETGEDFNVLKSFKSLVRRFAANTERRPTTDQLSTHPV